MGHRSSRSISTRTASNLIAGTSVRDDAYSNLIFVDSQEPVITITEQNVEQYAQDDEKIATLVAQYGTVTLVTCGSKSPNFMNYYTFIVDGECSCVRDRERNRVSLTGIPMLDRHAGERCKHVRYVASLQQSEVAHSGHNASSATPLWSRTP